uniref:metallophosphoesterase n=1 Tax=Eubacterium sp. TaxID=142586 RepID=UPI0025D8E43F
CYRISNDSISNLKIVQVSDFHNTKSDRLTNDLVNRIKEENPDLIFITGDLIDARKTDIDVSLNFIKFIKDIAPIYFVSGNHEASIRNYNELKNKLEEIGVNVLENEVDVLDIFNTKINIIGINDPSMAHEFIPDSDIIMSELNNIEYDDSFYTILLSHRPEVYNVYVNKKIDLVFTGHAHGGQIRIPFIGGVVAPNQGLFPKYTSGLFRNDETAMVISRGIGNSILPFRINNRPELVVVNIYK